MARSDLLLNLVRAGASGNQSLFRRSLEALIAEERAKNHTVLAASLAKSLQTLQNPAVGHVTSDNGIGKYLAEASPQKTFADLILPAAVRFLTTELVEEHLRSDLLHAYGIEPRNKIMLVGPPGNGKTSFAAALAEAIMVPLYTVKYHAVIGSFLGETALRLREMFEQARTRRCVLFLDEFDTVAKERGDIHETGEIKRVVSSLLLEIDNLPSYVVVVVATNHPELLDRAVWRRFQVRLHLPKPGFAEIQEWFRGFSSKVHLQLNLSNHEIRTVLLGLSFAEIEDFGNDIVRRRALNKPNGNVRQTVKQCLSQWHLRRTAVKRGRARA